VAISSSPLRRGIRLWWTVPFIPPFVVSLSNHEQNNLCGNCRGDPLGSPFNVIAWKTAFLPFAPSPVAGLPKAIPGVGRSTCSAPSVGSGLKPPHHVIASPPEAGVATSSSSFRRGRHMCLPESQHSVGAPPPTPS
jgi:hypothetical protein